MPWVLFLADFTYRVGPTRRLAYRRGTRHLVKQDCAAQAIEKRKAVAVERPPRRGTDARR